MSGHFESVSEVSFGPGPEVSGHFGIKPPRHFGTESLVKLCLVGIVLGPNCPDFSSIRCRSVLRQCGTGAEMSHAEVSWCRSVTLMAEVSGNRANMPWRNTSTFPADHGDMVEPHTCTSQRSRFDPHSFRSSDQLCAAP